MIKQLLLCTQAVFLFSIASNSTLAANTEVLRNYLERAVTSGSSVFSDLDTINRLYSDNRGHPLWFDGGPLASQREALLAEIKRASNHGLEPSRYHLQQLQQSTLKEEIQDILLSDALLLQIQHRTYGAVDRTAIDTDKGNWFIEHHQQTPESIFQAILKRPKSLTQALQELWPQHPDYTALVNKRAEIASLEKSHDLSLILQQVLKPGTNSPEVELLKQKLLGSGSYDTHYDSTLEEHVKRLQQDAGLEMDGIVGPDTLAVINASPTSLIEQIDANLERWRWLPRDVPESHIRVNIASFRLKVYEKQSTVMEMDVIVGRPYRQTPIFTENITYMVFNPYWNVPASIVRKDKLAILKQDAELMAGLGYEAAFGNSNEFISVDQIKWENIKPGQFSLRQKPGEKNALGKIKFMLPNPHDVYLHDTADKQLFAKAERFFSSGCIRLSQPRELAEWLLKRENNPAFNQLNDLFNSTRTKSTYLERPVPVYLVYLTAFTDTSGQVVFRRDRYNRDPAIIKALHTNMAKQPREPI